MAEHLASIFGTEKDRVNCPFYFKIGACRHGDRCSRLHTKPSISPTLLLSNMYQRPDSITPGVDPQGQPLDPRKIQDHFEVYFFSILLQPFMSCLCYFYSLRIIFVYPFHKVTNFHVFWGSRSSWCNGYIWWYFVRIDSILRRVYYMKLSLILRIYLIPHISLNVQVQDFYEDLFEELSKYGEIESLNICDNLADHMVCCYFAFKCFCFSFISDFVRLHFSLLWAGGECVCPV